MTKKKGPRKGTCPVCGRVFEKTPGNRVYCSAECSVVGTEERPLRPTGSKGTLNVGLSPLRTSALYVEKSTQVTAKSRCDARNALPPDSVLHRNMTGALAFRSVLSAEKRVPNPPCWCAGNAFKSFCTNGHGRVNRDTGNALSAVKTLSRTL